jgi:hypothetical protein
MWFYLQTWLLDRRNLRLLCVLVVAGWILAIGWFAFIVSLALLPSIATWAGSLIFSRPFYWIAPPLLLALVLPQWLLYLPTCPRCSGRLFSVKQSSSLLKTTAHDYRAEQFLFSYRSGAILKLARTGELRCMWCGYQLGTKLDYTVKPQ